MPARLSPRMATRRAFSLPRNHSPPLWRNRTFIVTPDKRGSTSAHGCLVFYSDWDHLSFFRFWLVLGDGANLLLNLSFREAEIMARIVRPVSIPIGFCLLLLLSAKRLRALGAQ